jgi:hypothetical protein
MLLEPPASSAGFQSERRAACFSESLSEEDILIATVKVRKDGRASIKALPLTPRDPSALDRCQTPSSVSQLSAYCGTRGTTALMRC